MVPNHPTEVQQESNRILMRTLARELTSEELDAIAGGLAATTSSKNCEPDDCDA